MSSANITPFSITNFQGVEIKGNIQSEYAWAISVKPLPHSCQRIKFVFDNRKSPFQQASNKLAQVVRKVENGEMGTYAFEARFHEGKLYLIFNNLPVYGRYTGSALILSGFTAGALNIPALPSVLTSAGSAIYSNARYRHPAEYHPAEDFLNGLQAAGTSLITRFVHELCKEKKSGSRSHALAVSIAGLIPNFLLMSIFPCFIEKKKYRKVDEEKDNGPSLIKLVVSGVLVTALGYWLGKALDSKFPSSENATCAQWVFREAAKSVACSVPMTLVQNILTDRPVGRDLDMNALVSGGMGALAGFNNYRKFKNISLEYPEGVDVEKLNVKKAELALRLQKLTEWKEQRDQLIEDEFGEIIDQIHKGRWRFRVEGRPIEKPPKTSDHADFRKKLINFLTEGFALEYWEGYEQTSESLSVDKALVRYRIREESDIWSLQCEIAKQDGILRDGNGRERYSSTINLNKMAQGMREYVLKDTGERIITFVSQIINTLWSVVGAR